MNRFVCFNSGEIFIYLDQIKDGLVRIRARTYVLTSATLFVISTRPHSCTKYVRVSNNISFVLLDEQKMPHLQERELFLKIYLSH